MQERIDAHDRRNHAPMATQLEAAVPPWTAVRCSSRNFSCVKREERQDNDGEAMGVQEHTSSSRARHDGVLGRRGTSGSRSNGAKNVDLLYVLVL